MRGRTIRLSVNRRLVIDAMRLSARVPTAAALRRMELGTVAAARMRCAGRPSWVALFVKAFALTADEVPELRRAYISFPWPHLYEYPENAALVMIERIHRGENVVFPFRVRNPAWLPLVQLSQVIREAKTAPIAEVTDFMRVLRIGALPWPLRRLLWWTAHSFAGLRANYFGTFVVSAISSWGAEGLFGLPPSTVLLTYGVVAPDGAVDVRVIWDHRVLDGAVMARALGRMEQVLCADITQELLSSQPPAADTPLPMSRIDWNPTPAG
jgi:hypothetical protein